MLLKKSRSVTSQQTTHRYRIYPFTHKMLHIQLSVTQKGTSHQQINKTRHLLDFRDNDVPI